MEGAERLQHFSPWVFGLVRESRAKKSCAMRLSGSPPQVRAASAGLDRRFVGEIPAGGESGRTWKKCYVSGVLCQQGPVNDTAEKERVRQRTG